MKVYTENTIDLTQEYFFRKKPFAQQIVILTIASLILIAFIWISFAPFEEVIKSTGYVRPLDNISPVANSVTGRIKNIFYKTGQHVTKGELLLSIDPTQLEAEHESLTNQILKEKNDLIGLYQIHESIIYGENRISDTQEEASLRYNLWITSLQRQENIKKLCFEDYQRELQISPSMTTAAKIQKLESEYTIACNDYNEIDLSFRYQIEQEINNTEIALQMNEAKLKEVENSLLYTKITAPINGTVQEIQAFNNNDWIQSGQMLLNIIPDKSEMTKIEILIPAKQAGKISEGQLVKMRFHSLPYFEFGGAEGKIITIDADSVKNENDEAYFRVITDIDKKKLKSKKGIEYPVKVGLQVDARIVVDKKTILQFILEKMNLWI